MFCPRCLNDHLRRESCDEAWKPRAPEGSRGAPEGSRGLPRLRRTRGAQRTAVQCGSCFHAISGPPSWPRCQWPALHARLA
jgi:hypothetical protein